MNHNILIILSNNLLMSIKDRIRMFNNIGESTNPPPAKNIIFQSHCVSKQQSLNSNDITTNDRKTKVTLDIEKHEQKIKELENIIASNDKKYEQKIKELEDTLVLSNRNYVQKINYQIETIVQHNETQHVSDLQTIETLTKTVDLLTKEIGEMQKVIADITNSNKIIEPKNDNIVPIATATIVDEPKLYYFGPTTITKSNEQQVCDFCSTVISDNKRVCDYCSTNILDVSLDKNLDKNLDRKYDVKLITCNPKLISNDNLNEPKSLAVSESIYGINFNNKKYPKKFRKAVRKIDFNTRYPKRMNFVIQQPKKISCVIRQIKCKTQ